MADKEEENEDDLDDLLEEQWAKQDEIHRKCEMKDNPEEKLKRWKEKHG